MQDVLLEWGYVILAWWSFGGGMLGLMTAGVLASSGEFNIYLVVAIAFVFNFLGDCFLFYLARTNQEYATKALEKYKAQIDFANTMMDKYGVVAIFVQKYLYGIKTLIPILIGLSKYDDKSFVVYNLFASFLWAVVVGSVAYMLGDVVLELVEQYKYKALIGFVLVAVGIWAISKYITSKQDMKGKNK